MYTNVDEMWPSMDEKQLFTCVKEMQPSVIEIWPCLDEMYANVDEMWPSMDEKQLFI
jgi:hypothetical protein